MMSQDKLIGRRVMAVDSTGRTRVPAKWQRKLTDGDIPSELTMSLVEQDDGTLEVRVQASD